MFFVFSSQIVIAWSNSNSDAQGTRSVELIVGGDFVVTMNDAQPVIKNGAVAIKDGKIIAVDKKDQILASYKADRTLPGEGMVLMPGLVNGHSHSAMVLFRGLADDLALEDWLLNYIFPAEAKFVDENFIRIGEQLACWEMIRGGTTTFVDMYFKPDVASEVVDECGLRAIIAPSSIDFPSPNFQGWDDAFAAAVDFVKRWKGKNPRIIPAIAPHAPYTVSPEHLTQAIEAARQYDVPLTIHLAETKTEVEDVQQRYNATPVQHLENLGFLEPRVFAAHVVWPNESEIALMAKRGIGVIHNPDSNLKLASGFAPIPAMLKAGIKVGLGTDGASSNNDLDMWEAIRLTAFIHKGTTLDPTAVPAKTVLRMATLGGAEALGLADKIGAIKVGLQADLIQVQLSEPHLTPIYDAISHLVYTADAQDVDTVIVDGKVLMHKREMLTLNPDRIRLEATSIAERIDAELRPN
ncbi:5-methylthioadenosine deaminase [Scytonema hofmannii PCC 7110]|uniref:5-methylthioadenosine/S-adenosylhomocysteine deaminase n=1 Tax=Scytonema hofmannii PCC 7110 TaxID=128403 RepID=A0A139WXT6_9CYAN|nr:amidohydrolase [Scytonema hofmannii]KYC37248.1 5-methylthioadenosine deaminase [Scytonema hofmannii PCC 7110]